MDKIVGDISYVFNLQNQHTHTHTQYTQQYNLYLSYVFWRLHRHHQGAQHKFHSCLILPIAVHAVDIWNVIEAFRENGLNTLEPQTEVNVSRLETLVSSLYHNLNKRLPVAQQVHVESCSGLLLNWLLAAYSV